MGNRVLFRICLVCIGFIIVQTLSAQDKVEQTNRNTVFFNTDSILDLTLVTDLSSLLADRGEDPSYHDARFSYTGQDGSTVQFGVKVRIRGNFRKKPESCQFPPLKFKFDEEETRGTVFEGFPDLKIVSHCQTGFPDFEQYVLQEYLIYKLYNIFTDFSFRVRLARIRYQDEAGYADSIYHFAFFLENPEDMAARNGGSVLELGTVPQDQLELDQLALVALFNYMIINTDYSIPILHNLELISLDYFKPPIPVPYDFDWSGMINIPYNYNYNEGKGYPQREYKGPCMKRKDLKKIFKYVKEKRTKAFMLYVKFPYLDADVRTRTLKDLNVFYRNIDDRRLVRKEIIENCYQ